MVQRVQRTWQGLNVDLSKLVKEIIQFFELNKFDNVTALETETGYQVIAGDSKRYKILNDATTTITGKPEDFTVSLTFSGERKQSSLPLTLASMIGLGYFNLKNFRSEEAMRKLEIDFGRELSKMIERTREPASPDKQTVQPP